MLIFIEKNEKNMQKRLYRTKKSSTFAKIIARQGVNRWLTEDYASITP